MLEDPTVPVHELMPAATQTVLIVAMTVMAALIPALLRVRSRLPRGLTLAM